MIEIRKPEGDNKSRLLYLVVNLDVVGNTRYITRLVISSRFCN